MISNLDEEITKLLAAYSSARQEEARNNLYNDLLKKYEDAKMKIIQLERELEANKTKLPSRDEVETMSSM